MSRLMREVRTTAPPWHPCITVFLVEISMSRVQRQCCRHLLERNDSAVSGSGSGCFRRSFEWGVGDNDHDDSESDAVPVTINREREVTAELLMSTVSHRDALKVVLRAQVAMPELFTRTPGNGPVGDRVAATYPGYGWSSAGLVS